VISPVFERESGVRLKPIAVGSGEALALGRRGDVDILLVHSPEDEKAFVAEGYGTRRYTIMYNEFLLLGPEADPAGVRSAKSIRDAFMRIAAARLVFVSRADKSGTHKRELALWKAAGIEPEKMPWYVKTGQGMGASLTVADEKGAYILCDKGTYLSRRNDLRLIVLFSSGGDLRNYYSLIPVNPKKNPRVRYPEAMKLVRFMTASKAQEMIRKFGGGGLFTPCWKE
jgi:tungstate transport system substrate-binding protein